MSEKKRGSSKKRTKFERIPASTTKKGSKSEKMDSPKPEVQQEDPLKRIIADIEKIREELDIKRGTVKNVYRLPSGLEVSELEEQVEDLVRDNDYQKWETWVNKLTKRNEELHQ